MSNTSHGTNMSLVIFLGIIIFGVAIGSFVIVVPVTMKPSDVIMLVLLAGFVSAVPYLASVRFYSPLVIDEDGKTFTTFNNSYEVINDELLGGNFALIYAGGYNSDRKYLSGHDITQTGSTTLLVVPTRLVESMANERFLIVRGRLEEASREEAKAFLQRRSVADALDGHVKSAKVHFVFASKTIHPDTAPMGVDIPAIIRNFQQSSGEVRETVKDQMDEFAGKIRFTREVRGPQPSPVEQIQEALVKKAKEGKEEKPWVI